MAIKGFLDWSGIATRGGGLDMFSNSIRKGVEYDAYGNQTRFKAVALTDAWPLAAAHADKLVSDPNWDWSSGSAEVASPSFVFKGRIIGDNSPHAFLPNPCDPAVASNPQQVMSIIKMHTSFVSSADVSEYDGGAVQEGDIVWVELQKNTFSYDLQYGVFLSKSKQGATVRGRQEEGTACDSLSAAFNDADWTTGGNAEGDPGHEPWSNRAMQEEARWTHPDTGGAVTIKNGEIHNHSRATELFRTDSSSGVQLLAPIMDDWLALKAAFEAKFPEAAPLKASGYRPYDGQVYQRMLRHTCTGQYDHRCHYEGTEKEMGHAANPGTSDHGWAAAVDLRGNAGVAVQTANGGVNPWRNSKSGGNAPNNKYFKWMNMYSKRHNFVFGVGGTSPEHWHLDWTLLGDHMSGQDTRQTSVFTGTNDSDDTITYG